MPDFNDAASSPAVAVGVGVPVITGIIAFFRHIFSRISAVEAAAAKDIAALERLVHSTDTDLRDAIDAAKQQAEESRDRLRQENATQFASIQAQLSRTATKDDVTALATDIKATIQLLLPRN